MIDLSRDLLRTSSLPETIFGLASRAKLAVVKNKNIELIQGIDFS